MPEPLTPPPRDPVPGLGTTLWPAVQPADSPALRRLKVAVRGGHAAMAAMIAVAVLGALVMDAAAFSRGQRFLLVAAACACVLWNLLGTRGAVGQLLWTGEAPLPPAARRPWGGIVPYFVIQLSLSGLVYWLGDLGQVPNLIWLALLPPVAYAVFLLERRGIVLVTGFTLALFGLSTFRWHGWYGVTRGMVAFSFALLFTVVFALLAVGAEKARNHAESLAAELRQANRKLREYAVQAEELSATRERNRLAREIHDSLGHYLTVIHVQIQAAEALLETDPARSASALEQARNLTREGLREIRSSVATLRASPLDNRQLAEALAAVVEEHRTSGLTCTLATEGAPRPLAPAAALTLYRAGQEGLTNVRKHAQAHRADLHLDFRDPRRVLLRVVDDGVGPAIAAGASPGFGLLGLRERVQLLGGRVTTGAAPGNGFCLEVEVPG